MNILEKIDIDILEQNILLYENILSNITYNYIYDVDNYFSCGLKKVNDLHFLHLQQPNIGFNLTLKVNDLDKVLSTIFGKFESYNFDSFDKFENACTILVDTISTLKETLVEPNIDYRLFPQQIDIADLCSLCLEGNHTSNSIREQLNLHLPEIKHCLRNNNFNTKTKNYTKTFARALELKEKKETFISIIKALIKYKNIITADNLKKFQYASVSRRVNDVKRMQQAIQVFESFLPLLEKVNNSTKQLDYIQDTDKIIELAKDTFEGHIEAKKQLSQQFSSSEINSMTKVHNRIPSLTKEVLFGKVLESLGYNPKQSSNISKGGTDFLAYKNNQYYHFSYKSEEKNFFMKNGGYHITSNGQIWDSVTPFSNLVLKFRNSVGNDKQLTHKNYIPLINDIIFSLNKEKISVKKTFLFYLTNLLEKDLTYVFCGKKSQKKSKEIHTLIDSFKIFDSLESFDKKYIFKNLNIKSYITKDATITFYCTFSVLDQKTTSIIENDFKFNFRNKQGPKGKSLSLDCNYLDVKNILNLFKIDRSSKELNKLCISA